MRKQYHRNSSLHWLKLATLSGNLMLGAAGAAQAENTDIEISANVNAGCVYNLADHVDLRATIQPIADNGSLTAAWTTINMGFLNCNSSHKIGLKTTNHGLATTSTVGTDSPGFVNIIPYSASASWGGHDIVLQADEGLDDYVEQQIENASSGNLSVRVDTETNADKFAIAGFYNDVLTVTITSN